MDAHVLTKLLRKASHLGAQGIEVIGWKPPDSASSDPEGKLIIHVRGFNAQAGGDTPWYQQKL